MLILGDKNVGVLFFLNFEIIFSVPILSPRVIESSPGPYTYYTPALLSKKKCYSHPPKKGKQVSP